MAYRIIMHGGVAIPAFVDRGDAQDIGMDEAANSLAKVPGRGYFDNYGMARSPKEIAPIQRSGEIHEDTAAALVDTFEALRGLLGKKEKLVIATDDESRRWVWARLIRAHLPRPFEAKQLWLPYDLTWIAEQQVLYGVWHRDWTHGDQSWLWDDGTAAFGVGAETATFGSGGTTLTFDHDGNIQAPHVVVEITASASSSITALTLTNSTNNFAWTYSGTIPAGGLLRVDSYLMGAWLLSGAKTVSSIVGNGAFLTATTSAAHGLTSGDNVFIDDDTLRFSGYYEDIIVVDTTTFRVPSERSGSSDGGSVHAATDAWADLDPLDDGLWTPLEPGENSLVVSGVTFGSGSPSDNNISVSWHDQYN